MHRRRFMGLIAATMIGFNSVTRFTVAADPWAGSTLTVAKIRKAARILNDSDPYSGYPAAMAKALADDFDRRIMKSLRGSR